MKNKILILFALTNAFVFTSCSDLEEDILDEALGQNLLDDPSAINNILSGVYGAMRDGWDSHRDIFMVTELSTDEAILPFRGGTNFTQVRNREMHSHTWTPLTDRFDDIWEDLYNPFRRSILLEDELPFLSVSDEIATQYIAEGRMASSFNQLYMLDFYDQMATRQNGQTVYLRGEEAADYLIAKVNSLQNDLPTIAEIGRTRFTQEAAAMLKMRIYLNKAVFADRYAADFTFEMDDMQMVVALADSLISGSLSTSLGLETEDYFRIFDVDNDNNPEHIFAINHNGEGHRQDLVWVSMSRARHGSLTHLQARGSDGVAITPEFFNSWNGNQDDPRFYKEIIPQDSSVTAVTADEWGQNRGIIVGRQYGVFYDPTSNNSFLQRTADGRFAIGPLFNFETDNARVIHTVEVDFAANNGHNAGARVHKYQFDEEAPDDGRFFTRVNIPLMRMGDVYLMQAEAYLRMGNSGAALALVNELRAARNHPTSLTSIDLETLYLERGYEMYWEHCRRTDMIRFGKYEDTYTEKSVTDVRRRLLPIPQIIIDSTTDGLLVQNEGY